MAQDIFVLYFLSSVMLWCLLKDCHKAMAEKSTCNKTNVISFNGSDQTAAFRALLQCHDELRMEKGWKRTAWYLVVSAA